MFTVVTLGLILLAIEQPAEGQLFRATVCQAPIEKFRDLRAAALEGEWNVTGVTEVFQSSFYVITKGNFDFDDGKRICKNNNGYLAEINTEEEYLFINRTLSDMLKDNRDIQLIRLGVLRNRNRLSFEGYTHPQDTIYIGPWTKAKLSIHHLPDDNFLSLEREGTGKSTFVISTEYMPAVASSTEAFLCEVSSQYLNL